MVDKERVAQLKDEGNQAFSKEKYNEAVDCYSKALLIEPNNVILYSNRAAAYIKLKDYKKALEDSEAVHFSDDLKHSKATTALFRIFSLWKHFTCSFRTNSFHFFEKAISFDPKWSKAYLWKGKALFHLQRLEEAKTAFLQGLELDPDNQLLIKSVEECNLALRQSGKSRTLKGINQFRITSFLMLLFSTIIEQCFFCCVSSWGERRFWMCIMHEIVLWTGHNTLRTYFLSKMSATFFRLQFKVSNLSVCSIYQCFSLTFD